MSRWSTPETGRRVTLAALFLLASLATTGAILRWILPPGPRSTLVGCGRGLVREVHFWLALAFLLVVLLHLVMHRAWVRRNLLSPTSKRGR